MVVVVVVACSLWCESGGEESGGWRVEVRRAESGGWR